MKFFGFSVAVFLVFLGVVSPAGAQDGGPLGFSQAYLGNSSDPEITYPYHKLETEVFIDTDTVPPIEPNVVLVQFLKNAPSTNLADRVDRMVQGITVDIPPEYDVYGYEIRRYMQNVGNPKIYTDNAYLRQQRVNVKKAGIILDYWRQELKKELQALEPFIQESNVAFATRTTYKQHTVTVQNFLSLAQSWIDANAAFLKYLDSMEGYYEYEYPKLTFKQPQQAKKFMRLLKKRQDLIIELRQLEIFRLMVY